MVRLYNHSIPSQTHHLFVENMTAPSFPCEYSFNHTSCHCRTGIIFPVNPSVLLCFFFVTGLFFLYQAEFFSSICSQLTCIISFQIKYTIIANMRRYFKFVPSAFVYIYSAEAIAFILWIKPFKLIFSFLNIYSKKIL